VAVLDASNFGGNLPRGAANPYAAITPAAVGTGAYTGILFSST